MEMVKIPKEEYLKMQMQIARLKELEREEFELTDWAKNELKEARKTTVKISHDDARKMLFTK